MSNTQEDRALEAKARRAANNAGFVAYRSRSRLSFDNNGGFMLADSRTNAVVYGLRYDLSAQDVIEFCNDRAQ
ncbi:hypothetical protein [Burkholderia cenocepacia]|uniref:hypothetical protein n=1 Tax=Burkholderia cenocepacia TaxID=95486 RepID=UPI002AB08913|nr:hypothetical protein [Burkholderia cenocepacia]